MQPIRARGSLEVHKAGFRAEVAEILAVWAPKEWDAEKRETVQSVARSYGVPCFSNRGEMIRYAERLAQPVPQAARPQFDSATLNAELIYLNPLIFLITGVLTFIANLFGHGALALDIWLAIVVSMTVLMAMTGMSTLVKAVIYGSKGFES